MDEPKATPVEAESAAPVNERDREALQPRRRRLPDERRALTHHFSIGGHEGYLTVGLYDRLSRDFRPRSPREQCCARSG
jgi:ribonucleoside-diphosphate reductase alpha chain